jgi:hypothetical protein
MAAVGLPALRLVRQTIARPALASTSRRWASSDLAADSASLPAEEEFSTANFTGMGTQPFSKEAQEILTAPINEDLIELRPGVPSRRLCIPEARPAHAA